MYALLRCGRSLQCLTDSSQAILTRATLLASQTKFSEAFALYIKAAQAYLHLSRTICPNSDISVNEVADLKMRLKAKASQALQRAEQIKAMKVSAGSLPLPPVKRDRFSPGEWKISPYQVG